MHTCLLGVVGLTPYCCAARTDADDETRRGLVEAAAKGQMKREARDQDVKKGHKPKPIQAYGGDE